MGEAMVRVTDGLSLAAAVPFLVGCEPTRSLVFVALAGGRWVRVCGRVDLPANPVQAPESWWFSTLGRQVDANDIDALVLVFCTDHPRRWRRAASRTARAVGALLPDPGRVQTLWRSGTAAGSYDEPVESASLAQLCDRPELRALAFDAAARGRRPLTRQALARQLDPECTGEAVPEHQLDDATTQLRGCTPDQVQQTVRALYGHLLAAADRGDGLPPDRAADLLAAITASVQARDQLALLALRDAAGTRVASVVAGLTRLTGQAPDRVAPAAAWVLAVSAYRAGDGVLANLSIDRVLRIDPAYPAAHLLVNLMCSGLRPEELDSLLTGSV